MTGELSIAFSGVLSEAKSSSDVISGFESGKFSLLFEDKFCDIFEKEVESKNGVVFSVKAN